MPRLGVEIFPNFVQSIEQKIFSAFRFFLLLVSTLQVRAMVGFSRFGDVLVH